MGVPNGSGRHRSGHDPSHPGRSAATLPERVFDTHSAGVSVS